MIDGTLALQISRETVPDFTTANTELVFIDSQTMKPTKAPSKISNLY